MITSDLGMLAGEDGEMIGSQFSVLGIELRYNGFEPFTERQSKALLSGPKTTLNQIICSYGKFLSGIPILLRVRKV